MLSMADVTVTCLAEPALICEDDGLGKTPRFGADD